VFFRGKENFLEKVFLPPNPHPFKNFSKRADTDVCQLKEHNISVAKSLFLKVFEVGGRGPGEGETFFKKFRPPPCLHFHFKNFQKKGFCMKDMRYF